MKSFIKQKHRILDTSQDEDIWGITRRYFFWMLVVTVLTQISGRAQNSEIVPEIKVIARAQNNQILLRWAANTPIAWKKLNRYGYTLERYTVTKDGRTLVKPEKRMIGQNFKPAPYQEWEALIDSNESGAIMAQAIYGESFEVEGSGGFASIINRAEEQQQRFAFGLYAADQDYEIAQKAGLGYVDKAVSPNEKYLYQVVSNVPISELKIKGGGTFIGVADYEPLPEPAEFVGVFEDGHTVLSWNSKLLSDTYNSYIVERTNNSENFTSLDQVPFTSIYKEGENSSRTVYIDSIQNNKAYTYRIKGVSSFGEVGPPSSIVSGSGKSILKYVPNLKSKKILSKNEVELTWEFPDKGVRDIKEFVLKRSDRDNGKYSPVITGISPNDRKVRYSKLKASNYFKITAIGKNNYSRDSFTMLVQPVDSIPPRKPEGLTGIIDSTGVVVLKWTPNKEKDLLGYRIYRGNRQQEEYSQITQSPVKTERFLDIVSVQNLGKYVYYQIIAVDQRYNQSKTSDILKLEKPDKVPPTSPVFTDYNVNDGKVTLQWAQSSSEDTVAEYIYRKSRVSDQWELVHQNNRKGLATFKDNSVNPGEFYSYTIIARDESGLESEPSPPVSVEIPRGTNDLEIKGFFAKINEQDQTILLSWRHKSTEVSSYEIYRSYDGQPSVLYKVLPGNSRRFTDSNLKINTPYKYIIRAVYIDGRHSTNRTTKITY